MNAEPGKLTAIEGGKSGPAVVAIETPGRWPSLQLAELWAYRELLYFLAWRDVKVRYKQTAIGAAWAILQPVLTAVMFTFIFSRIAGVSSDDLPYILFVYSALLPWHLFQGALTRSVTSVVGEAHLISKVYFPRLLVPFSATLSGLVDFSLSFVVLLVLMGWYGIVPTWGLLLLPALVVLVIGAALAVGLWLSAVNVRYRDVGHGIPFIISMWMFASPVAYSVTEIPERWRFLYGLNPMAGIIEAFRWALLGKEQPDFTMIGLTTLIIVVLLLGGIVYFKRMEETFADVV